MVIGNEILATEAIKRYDSIVIFHHVRPDGDCLGSQFGLAQLLRDNYPNKKIYTVGDTKGLFDFLSLKVDLPPDDEILKKSLGIIVDANFKDRIESRELLDKNLFPETLRIDHHPSEDDLNNCVRWVDSSYVAAAEMIAQLAKVNNWKITSRSADLIYLGINTDSGRFLYSNTSARTMYLVGMLYDNGLNGDFINQKLSRTSISNLKFNSWLVSTLKTRGQVAYIQNNLEDTKKQGKNSQNSVRVNLIANLEDNLIWLQFTEEENKKIRVEFRSNGPIVRNVALKWGGGGHERASGAVISSFDLVEQVVDDCILEIQNWKSNNQK